MEVIVIGAGSAGLLLAQGLKQHGIKCTVFEREDVTTYQTRPREWGMTLHWADEYLSKCIPPDLYCRLNEGICSDPYTTETPPIPKFNGLTGEKLFEMGGTLPRRVSRRKMRNFLSQGLDIQYGKKLVSIHHEPTNPAHPITAHFSNGTSAIGSALIGCDGSTSHTRTLLVGPELSTPEDLNNNMFNVPCRFNTATALLHRKVAAGTFVAFHPQGNIWMTAVQDIPSPTSDPSEHTYQHIFSWLGSPDADDLHDPSARLAFWRDQASRYAEPWRTFAKEFPDDLKIRVDRITAWRPSMDWAASFAGRVSLAGDAAHTMPPQRAQGLNHALQDAACIVDEMVLANAGKQGVAEALRRYEVAMKERALREIPISIRTAEDGHKFDLLLQTPAFKMGMGQYREEREGMGEGVERAA